LSLVSKSAYGAGAQVIGGIIGRNLKGEKTTWGKVGIDAATGAAGPTLSKAGAKLGAWAHGAASSEIEEKIGTKMSARHVQSLEKQVAAAKKAEHTGARAVEVIADTSVSTAKNLASSSDSQKH
jgi:hypothetical protein